MLEVSRPEGDIVVYVHCIYSYIACYIYTQGWIQDFLRGGQNNYIDGSLKQGSGGACSPPEASFRRLIFKHQNHTYCKILSILSKDKELCNQSSVYIE